MTNTRAKALEAFNDTIRYILINQKHHPLIEHAETIRTALAKSAKVDEDSMPCVSCGKPSQVSTPDDAEMCHECFGQFNATEYDLLKKQVDGLLEALNKITRVKTLPDHSLNTFNLTTVHLIANEAIQRFNGEV